MNEVEHVEGVSEDTQALTFHLQSNQVEWIQFTGKNKEDTIVKEVVIVRRREENEMK